MEQKRSRARPPCAPRRMAMVAAACAVLGTGAMAQGSPGAGASAGAGAGASSTAGEGPGIRFTFDGEVSQGLIWRAGQRKLSLVGPSNGGSAATDLEDDGNLNSKRGTLVSAPTTFLGTVEAQTGVHRLLLRGSLLNDARVTSTWKHWGADADPQALKDEVRDAVGRRARLLDAYYAADLSLGDAGALELKLGRQTILWGEAKFLGGGINMFNPVEAWKTHKAGVSLKEMILPKAAAAATWQVSPAVTLQGFYQLERAKFEYDPVGSFFSDIDLLGKGAGDTTVVPFAPPLLRGNDRDQEKRGQFGLAAFTRLDDWSLGLYFQNLNQRAAKVSGQGLNGQSSYFWEWPSDVKTYGLSFNRGLGSAAISGEIALRRGMPIGLDAAAVGAARINAALCGAIIKAPSNCGVDFARPPFNIPVPPLASTPLRADASGYVQGWTRVNQLALNLGLTQAFTGSDTLPRLLGASGGALFLEVSAIRSDLPDRTLLPTQVKDRWHGAFFGQLAVDYLRVAGSNVTVTPKLTVQTWFLGDDPTQAPFFKGRWMVTPGLAIRHDQSPDLTFEIGYTSIHDSGSRGDHPLADRDYLAMQLRWAF